MATTDVTVASHFADARQQHDSATFGMWLFLLTEVMLFGGLFTVYASYRWSYPDSFMAGSHHLDLWLGTVNTAVLIGSSLTMAMAQQAATRAARRGLVMFLSMTVLLGGLFLGIKSVEYAHKFQEHLVPGASFAWHADENGGPAQADTAVQQLELFFGLYFVMTGLHAFHMVLGLGVLLVLVAAALRGSRIATPVEMTALYWHFVDIVWIFLFPLLYLIGRHG